MNTPLTIQATVYEREEDLEGVRAEVYRSPNEKDMYRIDLRVPEHLMPGLAGGDKLIITIREKQK